MKFILTIDTNAVSTCDALAERLRALATRFDKDDDARIVDCCRHATSGELFFTDGETDTLYGHWALVEEH